MLHAPRQTGETSALLALRDLLNGGSEGGFRCVYVNVEAAQAAREDVGRAMQVIVGALASRARRLGDRFLYEAWPDIFATFGDGALGEALARWAEADPKPLVVLIDEIDSLIGDTLIAVLRQLRAGYDQRPDGLPQSVALCGGRDVHDYRIRSSGSIRSTGPQRFRCQEAWPQLLLQAFLQRVVDSGGRIVREYGLGRGRTDLLILWPRRGGADAVEGSDAGGAGAADPSVQQVVIECKAARGGLERTIAEGLEQTAAYMDRRTAGEGHLVVVDRDAGKRWEEQAFRRRLTSRTGAAIDVWGM